MLSTAQYRVSGETPAQGFTAPATAELEALSLPPRSDRDHLHHHLDSLGDLINRLAESPAGRRQLVCLRPYIEDFGPRIGRVRLAWHDNESPLPLELHRCSETEPSAHDLAHISQNSLLHWIALRAHATEINDLDFIRRLRCDARATEYGSIKVATWNVAALPSWLGAVTSPLTRFTPERFSEIGRRLADSDYDVVALQELWDGETRRLIAEARFSHSAPAKFSPGLIGRSGLAILSRHPILEYEERAFRHRTGVERFVKKGMLRALIELPNGSPCYIYTGHFISPPEPATHAVLSDERARDIRTRQFGELAEFMATGVPGIPTVVLGDFNCQPGDRDYTHLQNVLDIDLAAEKWRRSGRSPPTYDPVGNHWARGFHESAAAFDHIWVPQTTEHSLVLDAKLAETSPDFRDRHLSDHYLLSGTITWLNATESTSHSDTPVPPLIQDTAAAVFRARNATPV